MRDSSRQKRAYNKNKLETILVKTGFQRLFMYGNKSLAKTIWEDGKNAASFKHIIASGTASLYAKFLAAEVLRYFEVKLDPQNHSVLAEIYANALKNTSADRENSVRLNGNLWGFLYETNDAGYLGQQFIRFGDAAIPPLTKLLEDSAGRILYEGSKEATMGNAYQYRIKDFATFYISKIKDIPITFYRDLKERDKEIEKLRIFLKKH